MKLPVKILVVDIETAPLKALIWALYDQNISLGQLASDRHLMSFAAKWYGDDPSKVIYMDQRNACNKENDRLLVKKLRDLLDEADAILTQNGKSFDEKIINARMVIHGIKPPTGYKHIDTKRIASSKFGFISNKLEYLSGKLNKKYKKLKHKKFPGLELWTECLAGNTAAWDEMKMYNIHDILSLEELYRDYLQPWDNTINPNLYHDDPEVTVCMCGSTSFRKKGFSYTSSGKRQRFVCTKCGHNTSGKVNLLSKEHRKNLRTKA